jgi:hypothetical protein
MSQFACMSPLDAASVVKVLRRGERFIYYVGVLAEDRALDTEAGRAAHHLADFLRCQASEGEFVFEDGTTARGGGCGHLLQRRLDDGRYVYFFQKG